MYTIGISGASGFVGRNLLQDFKEYNVVCMSRQEINFIESHPEIDTFVHLAGKAHDTKNVVDPDEYYAANYQLTKLLYDSFLKSSVKNFIFISSVKAVADSLDSVLDENQLPNPQTHYGKSKLMAEQYIQSQPLPAGKSYYILRPCMIHGPGNKGNLNLLYQLVARGIPYPLAIFKNKRSFLSVGNLSFGISEIIKQKNIPSGIYNMADDEPLSTNEIIILLSEGLGRSGRLLYIPRLIINIVVKAGDKLKLPLNTERFNKLTENYVVSNKKIKNVLKRELPLSAREGLLITARSFKDV